MKFPLGLCQFGLVTVLEHLLLGPILLLQLLTVFNVLLLKFHVFFLKVVLHSLHRLNSLMEILALFCFCALAIQLDLFVGSFLFVLEVSDLLQVNLHLDIVIFLHRLCFSLAVQDLQLQFVNFCLSILVILLDHVSIHLDVVSFGFEIVAALFPETECLLELCCPHLHKLVVRLFLFLWLFWWHQLQIIQNVKASLPILSSLHDVPVLAGWAPTVPAFRQFSLSLSKIPDRSQKSHPSIPYSFINRSSLPLFSRENSVRSSLLRLNTVLLRSSSDFAEDSQSWHYISCR